MQNEFKKSGYLYDDYRVVHTADTHKKDIPFHYHDFHKLFLFLSRNVSYIVEGRQYDLLPRDMILVSAGRIHRPVIHDHSLYERVIFYISPHFFEHDRLEGTDLFQCFQHCEECHSSLIRPDDGSQKHLQRLITEIKNSVHDSGYGADLFRRLKFTELLLLINRSLQKKEYTAEKEAASNPIVLKAMDFINRSLSDDSLSVDRVAGEVALNRSYLMHLFKAQTGYTLGEYVKEKRLFRACTMLENGSSVTDACYESGFKNYSAFYYAFRKKYHASPAQGFHDEKQQEGE